MSQLFCCPRRRRAACRCGGLNAVTECRMVSIELIVPRVFGLSLRHHVRIQDHGIVKKKERRILNENDERN